ncbi:rhodanese-like domain-containing protein [Velocimicrobium porci]|nr:rhodanese-like domain-containing protein [Velocimicrobium porci]
MAFETISPNEMIGYMGKNGTLIIDLRKKEVFEKEHILGAINIPYEALEQKIRRLNGYKNIILYCERGNISLLAARQLEKEGINVKTLYGGIHGARSKLLMDGSKNFMDGE